MAGSCSTICVRVSAVHEAVNTRTACCVVISHWFEPVAATVACLSVHCELVLAVVNLSAGWRPARALGPVIVCWVGTVVCSACSSCVACSACSACFACSLFVWSYCTALLHSFDGVREVHCSVKGIKLQLCISACRASMSCKYRE